MAKVDLAPLVTVARGKLGNVIFSGQGGVDWIKPDANPNQPNSVPQRNVRAIIRNGGHVWGRMFLAQASLGFTAANPFINAWDFYIKKRKTTAYAAFINSFYRDAVANQGGENTRLVNSTAGNHPVEMVSTREGSNPRSVIVMVRTPDYYPRRFPFASVYAFVLPFYFPASVGRLLNFWITYRELPIAEADRLYAIQLDELPGVPLPTSNYIYGAGMIYRVAQGGRVLGYSTTVQRYQS